MAERGIIFSAPMVRALLDGRKTQTRRLLNPQPVWLEREGIVSGGWSWKGFHAWSDDVRFGVAIADHMPHAIGDQLYVREHWSVEPTYDTIPPRFLLPTTPVLTRADWQWHQSGDVTGRAFGKHRQGMHMPRWASRLTLTVTDVRVQRLQHISEEDARAEGVERCDARPDLWRSYGQSETASLDRYTDARASFISLWNSLHDKPATRWEDDPWLYALTFTVQHGNIDRIEHG